MDGGERRVGVVSRDVLLGEPGLAFLQGIAEGRHPTPPFARTTGIRLIEVAEGRAVFSGVPTPDFFNPIGSIHGGWIAGILDSALGCAVHTTLAVGEGYTTVEMKINYVRKVMPETGAVRCEAAVVHRGGSLATSEARLFDGAGKLLAHGTETCMILR